MNRKLNAIKLDVVKAMKALGYKAESGNIRIVEVSYNRYRVFHNGHPVGIWDVQRNTFVD